MLAPATMAGSSPLHTGSTGSATPTVSVRVIRKLVDMVERAGVPRDTFMRAAGLRSEQLESTAGRLSRHESYRIHELALDLTGDPALGLHWAARVSPRTFGPLSYLVAHAPDLRRGYACTSLFARLISSDDRHEVIEQGDRVTIRCRRAGDESIRIERFAAEMTMGIFARIVRDFGGPAIPSAVSFSYPRPDYHEEYTLFFGQTARYEQPFSELVFDRAVLALPSPYHDPEIHEALQTMAERRVVALTETLSYGQRVCELLVQRGGPRRADMESVARALGLSSRSLRRRLTDEGTTYGLLEADAFAIVAKQRLSINGHTIQQAAQDLGFSDIPAFHRAFKRCTGTTPAGFRQALLKGQPATG